MDIATNAAGGIATNAAGGLFSVVSQQVINVVRLEQNLQVLHYDLAFVEPYLRSLQTIFQNLQGEQKEIVDLCLNRMNHALAQATLLLERVQQQRNRCFGCCILCNRKLFRECTQWQTTFDGHFQSLQNQFGILVNAQNLANAQIPSNANQSVPIAAPEAKPLLLQPVPDAGFVGSDIKDAEMQLQRWLAEPPHRVVGVWGMGGIGKTSMLRIIHNHFQKVSRIFETVIWFTVSQTFNIGNLQNSIAKALDLKSFESLDNDSRRMTLYASLEKKKFLLILDDLWEPIDFDEVGISFGNVDKGSKVLISTRRYEVIGAMRAKDSCWEMKLLSEEEAWEVFKSKAFKNGSAALDTNIEAIAREIAKECKRLPLALNVVGAAMTVKETEDEWRLALNLMRNTDPNFPKLHKTIEEQLYKPLMYSYNDLSDHNIQSCFLYFAAFREDEKIAAERLVEIWIAEGFLTGNEITCLMDVGHGYLDLLEKRCLIQYVVPGEYVDVGDKYEYVKTIKIHDVLRDMAIHIGKSKEHWLFATDQHLTNFPGEKEISNCNRISLDHNDIQELPVLECPNLVSLLLPFNRKLRHVPQPFLSSVISLRVLDLSWTGITELPISVGELRLLEFLDLSSCHQLIELPETIGNLSALQFFNLQSCWGLKGLPGTIRGLKKLKHLNLCYCSGMEVNSDDIGQLISLNRLLVETVKTAVRAGDLIKLTKMRVLQADITADGGDVVTIDTWTEMKDLRLWFHSDGVNIEKIERVEILQLYKYGGVTLPHCEFQNLKAVVLRDCEKLRELPLCSFPMLTRLKLYYLEKLESLSGPLNVWNEGSMSKLQELEIRGCPSLKNFPSGMRLPNLKVLVIHRCVSIKALDIGNGDFPMLERLELYGLDQLESITGSSGVWNAEATSKLERVDITWCPLLKKLPLGMRLPNLKLLNIVQCNSIKELDIGNGDFPMLERLKLVWLKELESITGSSCVWNEEATSKLERVEIHHCPSLKKFPLGTRLPNLKVLDIQYCDSIKELDIGNRDFPMLEYLLLVGLEELESIRGSSGVGNEEATSKLERVEIYSCPLLKKLPLGMRLPNLKVLDISNCQSIKELDIGNGDFPMLERLELAELEELESITGSSGVWNEEATSKLESVRILYCPLLRGRLPRAMEKLFRLNKLEWKDGDEGVVSSELFSE